MNARDLLKFYGMQITTPRLLVVEDLMNNRFHATADEIYTRVNAQDESVSRATVYNVLKVLVENRAVRALTINDKQAHYDIDLTPHAHFRCTRCGRIIDIAMPSVGKAVLPEGCIIDNEELYYIGLCPVCVKLNTRNPRALIYTQSKTHMMYNQ